VGLLKVETEGHAREITMVVVQGQIKARPLFIHSNSSATSNLSRCIEACTAHVGIYEVYQAID
jgi:hypothetical protein